MQLKLLYFASLREHLGVDSETVEVPISVITLGDLRAWLIGRGTGYALGLAPQRAIRMALNKRLAQAETSLIEGAEVAFFPPVTGG
jgi:sulfur-carrier protein